MCPPFCLIDRKLDTEAKMHVQHALKAKGVIGVINSLKEDLGVRHFCSPFGGIGVTLKTPTRKLYAAYSFQGHLLMRQYVCMPRI
jgi:hypothetical protein